MIDIHCHILPGIDDGPKSLDESLAMLRVAEADGVRTIVATPHFGGAYEEHAPGLIRDLVATVNAAAASEGIGVAVLPGCEAQLTGDFVEKVRSGAILTLGDAGRYVLVEVASDPLPFYGLDLVFELRVDGITPILAHGERLAGTKPGRRFVGEFSRQGGLVQLNADAVGGAKGWALKRACRGLGKRGCFDVIASDGHNTTSRPPLLTPCLGGFAKRERDTVFERYCRLDYRPIT